MPSTRNSADGASRARSFGLACGRLKPGPRNAITDVPGVRVGHCTLDDGAVQTGVTAILPHAGNLYRDKPVAAADVLNGFGKSLGLMQVEELGVLETPILLTNTLSVGTAATALVRHAIAGNPDIGRATATVNPVVMECNDGPLNDIQALAVSEAHAASALAAAAGSPEAAEVASGAVGAGRGMSCFGFKGGIGTASRRLKLDGARHHLGVLVLANFGRPGELRLPDGRRVPPPSSDPSSDPAGEAAPEKGSVIVIAATDAPLDHRQLRRVIRRAGVGLARVGSFWGHGSGDIALGFTTANRLGHDEAADTVALRMLNERRIDMLFEAMADATQEAVLDALAAATPVVGRDGATRPCLRDVLTSGSSS
ncbi:DmpA family aminopeptidase [Azospirillum picis]|uniref:D-aminopeptidase n=1 Tax=Azospirillum picis TaxID=488438 RepID=A0ABU0MQ92_9PROT|nr:P1 family peptidase [Azospirillum picis]MBP2302066.1 D-aminopeptidase [Azospirillum picis]MDQ0535643.1 D-aminopeptidase [Azospirillum picis]